MPDKENENILDMVTQAEQQAQNAAIRALIIQPGAIGDCILTLPLAEFLKTHLGIGSILMLGKSYYIDYFPTRTCIDGIRDIDSIDLHRLFVSHRTFELKDGDPLITAFAGYQQIITFLGDPDSDFEANLIFTAYCSNPADIITIRLKPLTSFSGHISQFYIDSLISAQSLRLDSKNINLKKRYITPTQSDLNNGKKILKNIGVNTEKLVIIHPGSGSISKCWNIDNFYLLAEQLSDLKVNIAFILGPAEMERFKEKTIDTLGTIAPLLCELSLLETLQVISCADCFIGNDSGISHLSAAASIPTIACFGPTEPDNYTPLGPYVSTFKFLPADFDFPSPESVQAVAKKALEYLSY